VAKTLLYQIRLQEQLDAQWAEWFAPLMLHTEANGNTILSGRLRDQGELYGVLAKVRDLNLTLLAVTCTSAEIGAG
jgi:hypothetical protein